MSIPALIESIRRSLVESPDSMEVPGLGWVTWGGGKGWPTAFFIWGSGVWIGRTTHGSLMCRIADGDDGDYRISDPTPEEHKSLVDMWRIGKDNRDDPRGCTGRWWHLDGITYVSVWGGRDACLNHRAAIEKALSKAPVGPVKWEIYTSADAARFRVTGKKSVFIDDADWWRGAFTSRRRPDAEYRILVPESRSEEHPDTKHL